MKPLKLWQIIKDHPEPPKPPKIRKKSRPYQCKRTKIDWEVIDWSKSSRQIANELQLTYSYVQNERKRRGIPPTRRHEVKHIQPKWYKWETVDWSKHNAQIARDLGCSRWAVTLARRKKDNQENF